MGLGPFRLGVLLQERDLIWKSLNKRIASRYIFAHTKNQNMICSNMSFDTHGKACSLGKIL